MNSRGFSPKLIFIKCDSTTGSWTIYDTARGPENPNKSVLFWNDHAVESTSHISGANIDIFSNGFKIKTADNTLNTLGEIYTYGAWAEYPQQTTNQVEEHKSNNFSTNNYNTQLTINNEK